MRERRPRQTLVVGIGSPHGNDRLGWDVVDAVARHLEPGSAAVTVRRAQVPSDLLDWLDECDRLIVCDACRMGMPLGSIRRWNWPDPEILSQQLAGSHSWHLPGVLELSATLGRLPPEVIVWGAEAGSETAHPATPLSPELAATVSALSRDIAGEACRA